MKNAFYVLCLLLVLRVTALAAPDSDFSGTWVDQSPMESKMFVTQTESALLVKYSRTPVQKEYIIDGIERKMSADVGGGIFYTAKWDGPALVIDESASIKTPFGTASNRISRQVWSLSGDGKILTISTTSQDSKGETEIAVMQVYDKADNDSHGAGHPGW